MLASIVQRTGTTIRKNAGWYCDARARARADTHKGPRMMSDRVVRDELLTSERYWSVSIEAQRLFVHLILVVDDSARFSGKPFTIAASCFPGHQVTGEKVERLLCELVDRDLIRMYQIDDERFIYLPRFRQRQRYVNSKYPEPPLEIIDLNNKKSDHGLTQDGPESDLRRLARARVAVAVAVPVAVSVAVPENQGEALASSPPSGLSAGASLSVIEIPLHDNTSFAVTQAMVAEFVALYPAVDVPQTLNEIRGWNMSNPSKRKTRRGVLAHVNRWLAKEQNRG